MAESARVSSKGQLVIPAKLREELGFRAGVKVFFTKTDTGLLIEPSRFDALRALRGSLAGYSLERDLMEDPIEIAVERRFVKEYVLDANALMRYFQNDEGAETIDKLIARAQRDEVKLSISAINLGEVLYTLAKSIGLDRTNVYIKALGQSVETVAIDQEFALAASTIKFQYRLGYADSIAALLAMRLRATLVTADPEFVKLGKRLKVLALPRYSA